MVRNLIFVYIVESLEEHRGAPLLLIQASIFSCGGLPVGVATSHKIADGNTVSSFIIDWANSARGADLNIYIF